MPGKNYRHLVLFVALAVLVAAVPAVSSAQSPITSDHGTIRLAVGDIDPSEVGLLTIDQANVPGRYIVQFDRPVSRADRAALEAGGARVMGYLPDLAFAVRIGPGASVPDLDGISAIIEFRPDWRISPRLGEGNQLVRIVVDGDVGAAAVLDHIEETGLTVVRHTADSVIAGIDGAIPVALTAHDAIAWVEPFTLRETHNEDGGAIIGIPTAHAGGYDGSTQIVAVADTGLGDAQEDGDTTDGTYGGADPHPDIPASRVVEVLDYPASNGNCALGATYTAFPDGAQDVDSGHGTHVSGSVLSDGDMGIGLGTAPAARLVFQATEDYADMGALCEFLGFDDGYYLLGLPDDIGDLFQDAYDLGARIHSDSWGSDVSGDYTEDSAAADQFMWDNPDMLIITSAGNSGVDGDSSGEVDDDSMGSPATAKNLLTVGASEGDRADDFACDTGLAYTTCAADGGTNTPFTYGAAWPTDFPVGPIGTDSSAGNAEQMAAFSSRGPTDDGRIKPDVVAPGTWILSGYSSEYQEEYVGVVNPQNGAYQYDGWGFPYSTDYKYMGGTSMATPLTSGGAAVVRDFYNKEHSHEASAALTKATLINSARDLLDENNDGADDNDYPIPNSHEGWGLVQIDEATDGDHVFADSVPIDTAETVGYSIDVPGGAPLKVTVVWTDYPSTAGAGVNLVNNLDLTVTSPGGTTTYLGNVFSGGWSATGGSADTLNNVENVYVASAAAGVWTIDIDGTNVPQGPQPFAIVIQGGTFADTEAPVWPNDAEISQTGQTNNSITVDWSANPATDNTAVTAYDVYVDGGLDQSVAGTMATITGLDEATGYTVQVEARDAAGNATVDGPSVAAATIDGTPPSWPDLTIRAREVFETSLELHWEAATDGVGVDHYTVSVDGEVLATTPDTHVVLDGLSAETTYSFTVAAHDPSNNSADGPTLDVTTAIDFLDTNGHIFEDDIAWMAARGITFGCGDGNFCPDQELTRQQMASLIARAFGLVGDASDNEFEDVSGLHTANIVAIADAGITVGCSTDPLLFCPDDLMSRGQMGSFMQRAFGLPLSDADLFTDDDGITHERAINAIALVGITLGCDPGLYCPDDPVTRGQLAAFLHRGFVNLELD